MKRFNIFVLSFLLIISAALTASAATFFYVSDAGSDDNPGTQNAPFATIQKAADVANAGDTVRVLAGIYTPQNAAPDRGMIIFRRSGTSGNPITFEAVGSVIVKGDGGVWKFGGIFEISADQNNNEIIHDLVIRGFRLENSVWFGIKLGKTKNISLENNYTYNTGGSGIIALQSQNITIRGNTLEKACVSPDTTIDTQEIISLIEVDRFEIDRNHIFNGGIIKGGNGGEGIDAKTGSRNGTIHHNKVHDLVRLGIYVDSWDRVVENIEVYSNIVYRCSAGVAVSSEDGGTVRNLKIFNNVLYDNQYGGVVISAWVKNGPREQIEIVNNTIFHNGFRADKQKEWGAGIIIETTKAKNVVIRNNIVSQNKTAQIMVNAGASDIAIDHNLIDGFRNYTDENYREPRGETFVQGDPQFIDAGSGNFQLKPNSPAIERGGKLLAPDKDFNLNSRPQTGGIDIGAFETGKTVRPVK